MNRTLLEWPSLPTETLCSCHMVAPCSWLNQDGVLSTGNTNGGAGFVIRYSVSNLIIASIPLVGVSGKMAETLGAWSGLRCAGSLRWGQRKCGLRTIQKESFTESIPEKEMYSGVVMRMNMSMSPIKHAK